MGCSGAFCTFTLPCLCSFQVASIRRLQPLREKVIFPTAESEQLSTMISEEQPINGDQAAPSTATAAVLKPSDPLAPGMQEVSGIDFDKYAGKDITVNELVAGMRNTGFQATAVTEAVRIINDMVPFYSHLHVTSGLLTWSSVPGKTPRRAPKLPSSSATPPTSFPPACGTSFAGWSSTSTSPAS